MEKTSVIGIDFGTSGCRGVVLDASATTLAEASLPMAAVVPGNSGTEQSPDHWWTALQRLIEQLLQQVTPQSIGAIALDGTSGTTLLTSPDGSALTTALMYNDNRATVQAQRIAAIAPRESAAHGTGAGLAKAMWLLEQQPGIHNRQIHTQAGWLSNRLCGSGHSTDANNALKLGYDPLKRCWPPWLAKLGIDSAMLPDVFEPGFPIGRLSPSLASRWGLSPDTCICAGTTDSTAAFIASGASRTGEAVTSLGSTLVMKVLSSRPVFDAGYGVYSQPLNGQWLVGGGSNSGGAVLRHFFNDQRIERLTRQLEPQHPSGLDYYPLLRPGERFPVNDPALAPRLTPRPEDDVRFFQALLEGMAKIEKQGYDRLAALGAPYPISVRSNGGGAANHAWTQIRGSLLGVPMLEPVHLQACYGSAMLAMRCLEKNGTY